MRTGRKLLFLLPTVSTGLVRIVQLVILLVLSNVASGSERNILVAGFGLLSSFAMMTDSGAGNFLLSTPVEKIRRGVYRKAVGFHFGLAAGGAVLALVFISYPAGGTIPSQVLSLLVVFAVTQTLDSTCRIVRAPLMVAKRDALFAVPDLLLFVVKLPLIALAVVHDDLSFLLLLWIPSAIVLVGTYVLVERGITRVRGDERRVVSRILEFGVTGALSAFYSQAPLLFGAAFLSLEELATLTIVYRIVQALDLVPGTLSLQLIPRVRERATGPWAYWTAFALGGAVISLVVILFMPLVELLFGNHFEDPLVFVLVALSFIPKSGNYALVAYLMGIGKIRVRFLLTACACVISVALAVVLGINFGVVGLAAVTLLVEILFVGGAFLVLRKGLVRVAREPG